MRRILPVRGRPLWAMVGLGAALLALGAGLWVGAIKAPTHQPSSHVQSTGGHPGGNIGLPRNYPAPPASPLAWNPLPPATNAFVPVQIVVERIGVKAAVEDKGIDSHNVMEAPDRPFDVAWYTFTGKPGSGSNAVFAGHLDYWGVGPAVFWHLGDVRAGDLIDVVSPQQTEVRYQVTSLTSYSLTSIPMASILAPGKEDQLTLMTCTGDFHQSGGYDHRLVVRATRVS